VRRLVVFLIAVVGILGAPLHAGTAGASTDPVADEAAFVVRINELRASKGLGQLTVHPELVQVARSWAGEMAEADRISHNPGLADAVKADWLRLGENVGVGMTVDRLHTAFVASPLHYKNLVDPSFTYVGVGVVLGRDGVIFTTHQFMKLRAGAAAPSTSAAPSTTSAPPSTTTTARAAVVPAPTPTPAPASAGPVATARFVLVLQQLRALDAR